MNDDNVTGRAGSARASLCEVPIDEGGLPPGIEENDRDLAAEAAGED